MKSPEKGLDLESNPFFRVNLCLLRQIALGIFTRILQSQPLESETYTNRLGQRKFLPPLLPSRTDEHVSRIPLPSSLLGSCFEKKEKEPKKKGKRTEKERNSVTTSVGRRVVFEPSFSQNTHRYLDISEKLCIFAEPKRTFLLQNGNI